MASRSKASLSDEYETPKELFQLLCGYYGLAPELDVCATKENKKCKYFITKEVDALEEDWLHDAWCNPPHSMTEKFVRKAYEQWKKHNNNIIMIIPANSMCTKYAHRYILQKGVEFYPIIGRPRFLVKGKKSRFNSRNSYFVVIWREQHYGFEF